MLFYLPPKMIVVNLFCLLFYLLQLSHSLSQENSERMDNFTYRELIFPTPLLTHLNQSTAQLLIEDANNMFVSNTSLMDFTSDNETLQLHLRYRERKRKLRLQAIQMEVLRKLGLTRSPNVTDRLSMEERQSLVSSFDRTMIERSDNETSVDDTEDRVVEIGL